jgi:ABC-type enterochelin transport system permease subunit
MASVSHTADVGPIAALSFASGLFATAVLIGMDAPNGVAIAVLALVAISAAAFVRPIGALAVALAPALFADHIFIAPYDSIDFARRDLVVLLGIPLAALFASVAVSTFIAVRFYIESHRSYRLTTHDRWLLSLGQSAHVLSERHSDD